MERNIVELLILAKNTYLQAKKGDFDEYSYITNKGLCKCFYFLHIRNKMTDCEYIKIMKYLFDNAYKGCHKGSYWWPAGEIKPRLMWLNIQIFKQKHPRLHNSVVVIKRFVQNI